MQAPVSNVSPPTVKPLGHSSLALRLNLLVKDDWFDAPGASTRILYDRSSSLVSEYPGWHSPTEGR